MKSTALAVQAHPTTALSVEVARQILAHCKTVDVAKDIRDQAVAVAAYLKEQKDATFARDDAYEIALRAERRMGELLARAGRHAGRPSKGSTVSRLKDIGVSKKDSSRAQQLAKLPEAEFHGRIKKLREKSGKLTSSKILAPTESTDYDGDSWMTPPDIIEKARHVLGGIDIDPASSAEANKVVKAKRLYTKEDDGLSKAWVGKAWLNPPYSSPLCGKFIEKLIKMHALRAVPSAILLVNNATDTKWFQTMAARFPVCLTAGRLGFVLPGGHKVEGNRQGQALFFIGCDMLLAKRAFADVGVILEPL